MAFTDLTIQQFLDQTASSEPTPGGGAVCATTAAASAALVAMVCRLTLGKQGYEDVQAQMRAALGEVEALRSRLAQLAQEDALAYQAYLTALRLPKATAEQRGERSLALRVASRRAAEVPLEIARGCVATLVQAERVAPLGNRHAVTDVGAAAGLAEAAMGGALLFIAVNLPGVRDPEWMKTVQHELEQLRSQAADLSAAVLKVARGG